MRSIILTIGLFAAGFAVTSITADFMSSHARAQAVAKASASGTYQPPAVRSAAVQR